MRFHRKQLLASALVLATLMVGSATQRALAGFPIGNAVTMGGEPVFWIKAEADGFSPEHRAQLSQDALDNALATAPACAPSLVTVERTNGAPTVKLNGHLVATADFGSARQENLTPNQLAEKWAENIRGFLADQQKAKSYQNSLIGFNPIQASITYVERRLFAPEGTSLPVSFEKALSSSTLKLNQIVYGTIVEDVPVGHFLIPAGSVVSGKVIETEPNRLTISFTELTTPSGRKTPINASIANTYTVASEKPHPVCTLSMPAGLKTNARVPAMVAIGAPSETVSERLAFIPGSSFEIAPGEEVTVVLNQVTPVALVERNMPM